MVLHLPLPTLSFCRAISTTYAYSTPFYTLITPFSQRPMLPYFKHLLAVRARRVRICSTAALLLPLVCLKHWFCAHARITRRAYHMHTRHCLLYPLLACHLVSPRLLPRAFDFTSSWFMLRSPRLRLTTRACALPHRRAFSACTAWQAFAATHLPPPLPARTLRHSVGAQRRLYTIFAVTRGTYRSLLPLPFTCTITTLRHLPRACNTLIVPQRRSSAITAAPHISGDAYVASIAGT